MYKLLDNVYGVSLALYLASENTLVLSDVHIGFEETLNKKGVLLPRLQLQEIKKQLSQILAQLRKEFRIMKLHKIVLNGDIKHEFGTVNAQEWREMARFLQILKRYTSKIVVVKGNHDVIFHPLANKYNLEIKDADYIGDLLIMHGDALPHKKQLKKRPRAIIIGHEHPAIAFAERNDKYKCFLKTHWKKIPLIVTPSFFFFRAGMDITAKETHSPFLQNVSDNTEVFVVDPESQDILAFGKLKDIISL